MELKSATFLEALSAFILLIKNYQEKKYLPSSLSIQFFSKVIPYFCVLMWKYITFKATKGGETFVAKEGDRVVGTMTVEFSSSIPCVEKIFAQEMKNLRIEASSFAYIGSFAIRSKNSRTCLRMIREVENILRWRRIEVGICVVNPSHCSFYEKYGFKVIAQRENMEGLSNATAVLLVIHA